MKDSSNQSGKVVRSGSVSIWLFSGAFLGLLIGLFEASLLWTTPRFIPLLVPDVGWVIWFLAPLVDMIFFAMVGLVLGLLARRIRCPQLFAAFEAALGGTFIFFAVEFSHAEIGMHPFNFEVEVVWPLAILGLQVGLFLLFFQATWGRFSRFAERWLPLLKRPIASGLSVAAVVAAAGIGIFVAGPWFSAKTVNAAPPPSGAPNIVFITLDTVRADHLSSYGYWRHTTPNLDRFARTGVLFENAISASSWTLASHSSMFTGLLPQQHGADWAVPLASTPWTLAEILRSRGYQTAGVVANLSYLQKGWGIAQGFESYNDNSDSLGSNLSETLIGNAIVQPLFQNVASYNQFFRRNAADINRDVFHWYQHRSGQPYFLFINYFDAHEPYLPPEPYNHRFGTVSNRLARKLYLFHQEVNPTDSFTAAERRSLIAGYDNSLAYLDSQIGKLLAFLRQSPQWQNTIVVITSDHGDEFGVHGSYDHVRDIYRQVLHVPLIIEGPGVPKGMRISHLVGTRQLFSTVLDLAGRGHTRFSRTSLARFWNPNFKPGPVDDAVVSEMVPMVDLSAQHPLISLTTPRWQFIEHRDGRQELYDWVVDPKEEDNLAAAPGEKTTLEGLRSRLVKLVGDATGPWQGMPYLRALDTVKGPARLSLLHPRSLQQETKDIPLPIGIAQAFFESDENTPIRPSQPDRELMQSLPYQ